MPNCCRWPKLTETRSFMESKLIAIEFQWAQQMVLEVNTITGDVIGWQNSKNIKYRRFDSCRRSSDRPLASETLTRACAQPKYGRDCKEAPLWFTESIGFPRWTNRILYRLSIVMFIDNLRQNQRLVKKGDQIDRSPTMVSLIFTRTVSVNRKQKQRRYVW